MTSTHTSTAAIQQMNAIQKLQEKDVVYVEADKSNHIVFMNTADYNDRVHQLIAECG